MLSQVSARVVGPTGGRVRLARAGALGGGSLLLASGAHLVGGGSLPGPGVLLVAAAVLGLVATLLTARRCGFGVLALLLAGEQVLLHTLFTVASSATHVHLAAPAHHVGPLHAPGLTPEALQAATAGPAMDMPGPGWLMWVAHVVATLATAWLLARGEAWLWRAAESVAVAAGLRCAVRVRRTAPATVPPAPALLRCLSPVWLVTGPRGPPAVVAA